MYSGHFCQSDTHTGLCAQGNTLFCSTANNVGECMVSLTTSQSPLVLSGNVYVSPPNSLLSPSTQPQLTLQSLICSLTPGILPILGTTPGISRTSYPPKSATVKSEKPFYIAKLNNRIKKCSGCGQLFRELGTTTPDYVIGNLE